MFAFHVFLFCACKNNNRREKSNNSIKNKDNIWSSFEFNGIRRWNIFDLFFESTPFFVSTCNQYDFFFSVFCLIENILITAVNYSLFHWNYPISVSLSPIVWQPVTVNSSTGIHFSISFCQSNEFTIWLFITNFPSTTRIPYSSLHLKFDSYFNKTKNTFTFYILWIYIWK